MIRVESITFPLPSSASGWRVSVSALEVLASEVAAVLDVLYTSDEKDKVLPLLTQLMTHTTPYLRNHS